MYDLAMGLEDADTSLLETRLELSNLHFQDSQTVSGRRRERGSGWTVSVRQASATPHGCPAGVVRYRSSGAGTRHNRVTFDCS